LDKFHSHSGSTFLMCKVKGVVVEERLDYLSVLFQVYASQ
jgi:hypothetical protein